MEGKNSNPNADSLKLVTVADLERFRQDLIAELRRLISPAKSLSPKKWLKSRDVRKLLGISAGKLQTMRDTGQIPFMRVGGVIYYEQYELEEAIANAKVQRGQLYERR